MKNLFDNNIEKKAAKPQEGPSFGDCMFEIARDVIKSHLPSRTEAVSYACHVPLKADQDMELAYADVPSNA